MNKPQRTVAEGCSRSHAASYAPRRKKMIAMDSEFPLRLGLRQTLVEAGDRKVKKTGAEAWPRGGQGRVSLGSRILGSYKSWFSLPQEAELERLEREFAIQSQITEAARRLASDPNVSKKLKKQRKTSYLNALKKLQEIENAINENRIKSGKKPTQRASLVIDGQCHPQALALLPDNQVLLGPSPDPGRI